MSKIQHSVLIVDDDPVNIHASFNALDSEGLNISFAKSGVEALERLSQFEFDLILLDIMMPEMDGFELCAKLKQLPLYRNIPVIFLTARDDTDTIEKAYDAGGVDYVTKPCKSRELIVRVNSQLRQLETLRELEFLASRDSLTGVYNRRMFFTLGQKVFAESVASTAVLMIDIDHFKNFNDSYGHHQLHQLQY